ncbi:MAG: XRE family transcriptional regulator [Alphaproteobacteria bacterium HGW-Alphaproteobacteria-16]|nr:MAG: XRE family transcriptional regulator [Alphaproteobacteria bacterium HGW-Alphaproteobacteria-16]
MIKERRCAAGLTQMQVAQALSRPQSFVTTVEAGDRRIDVVELINLASAIGFDPAEAVRELAASEDDA